MVFSWGDGKKDQLGHGSKELTIHTSPRHSNIALSLYTHVHTHTHTKVFIGNLPAMGRGWVIIK